MVILPLSQSVSAIQLGLDAIHDPVMVTAQQDQVGNVVELILAEMRVPPWMSGIAGLPWVYVAYLANRDRAPLCHR